MQLEQLPAAKADAIVQTAQEVMDALPVLDASCRLRIV
jgi:hypothetical protein